LASSVASWLAVRPVRCEKSEQAVIPAKAGIQRLQTAAKALDPSFRWDDEHKTWQNSL
jgi:hypothetical protein